jgi:hypothetical protein
MAWMPAYIAVRNLLCTISMGQTIETALPDGRRQDYLPQWQV